MTFALLGAAVVLLALPRLVWRLGRTLHPREWVRLGVAAVLGGAIALELGLILLAIPTLLRALGVPDLAATCRRVLGELAPGGVPVGWSAALLSVALPLRASHGWSRARRLLAQMEVEPDLGRHLVEGGIDFVLLPTRAMVAYSVDGATPQVVVSAGLLETLTAAEHGAVLRHEITHLRHGHQRLLFLLSGVEGAVPPMRPSAAVLRAGIERWADEEAAGDSGPARNMLCDALLRATGVVDAEPVIAAFATVETVVERVRGLAAGAPSPRPVDRMVVHGAVFTTSVVGVAALAGWAVEAHVMLGMVGLC